MVKLVVCQASLHKDRTVYEMLRRAYDRPSSNQEMLITAWSIRLMASAGRTADGRIATRLILDWDTDGLTVCSAFDATGAEIDVDDCEEHIFVWASNLRTPALFGSDGDPERGPYVLDLAAFAPPNGARKWGPRGVLLPAYPRHVESLIRALPVSLWDDLIGL